MKIKYLKKYLSDTQRSYIFLIKSNIFSPLVIAIDERFFLIIDVYFSYWIQVKHREQILLFMVTSLFPLWINFLLFLPNTSFLFLCFLIFRFLGHGRCLSPFAPEYFSIYRHLRTLLELKSNLCHSTQCSLVLCVLKYLLYFSTICFYYIHGVLVFRSGMQLAAYRWF